MVIVLRHSRMAFFAILELLYKDHDAAITVNGGCLHLESEE
jgi:hypothetical protein